MTCEKCKSSNVKEVFLVNHGNRQNFAHCIRCGHKTQLTVRVEG